MSALVSLLMALAEQDKEAARARGASELLEKVIDATFGCAPHEIERHTALSNVFRELVQPGAKPLTPDQVARIEGLIAGGGR